MKACIVLEEIIGPDSIVDCLIEGEKCHYDITHGCLLQSFSFGIQGKGHPSGHPAPSQSLLRFPYLLCMFLSDAFSPQ